MRTPAAGTELDQRLRDAITDGDDRALNGIAIELDAAGLPELAQVGRSKQTAGLRDLLGIQ